MKPGRGWKPQSESVYNIPMGGGSTDRSTRELIRKRCHLGQMQSAFKPWFESEWYLKRAQPWQIRNLKRNYFRIGLADEFLKR
jgi:hypothetical protein